VLSGDCLGFSLASHRRLGDATKAMSELVIATLSLALPRVRCGTKLLHHSDRGGNCRDNAPVGSSLKAELLPGPAVARHAHADNGDRRVHRLLQLSTAPLGA
jgi:hypothetical protein